MYLIKCKFSIIRYEVLLIGPFLYTDDSNRNHRLSEKVLEVINAKMSDPIVKEDMTWDLRFSRESYDWDIAQGRHQSFLNTFKL